MGRVIEMIWEPPPRITEHPGENLMDNEIRQFQERLTDYCKAEGCVVNLGQVSQAEIRRRYTLWQTACWTSQRSRERQWLHTVSPDGREGDALEHLYIHMLEQTIPEPSGFHRELERYKKNLGCPKAKDAAQLMIEGDIFGHYGIEGIYGHRAAPYLVWQFFKSMDTRGELDLAPDFFIQLNEFSQKRITYHGPMRDLVAEYGKRTMFFVEWLDFLKNPVYDAPIFLIHSMFMLPDAAQSDQSCDQ